MRNNYDALISYNTGMDEAISRELRRRLIHFAKPFWRMRSVNVYRDKDSGVPSPDLHSGLRKVVKNAKFLILLACPESAASDYVRWEIAEWTRAVRKRKESASEQLIIVRTSGKIALTEKDQRIDWNSTDALPDDLGNPWTDNKINLSDILVGTPKIYDLSWMRETGNWSEHESELTDVVAAISSLLRDKAQHDLKSEEILGHRRKLRITISALVLFVFLGLFATWQWQVSRNRAKRIRADAIVSRARLIEDEDPLMASLLLCELDLRVQSPPDATQLGLDLLKEHVPISFFRLSKSDVSDLVFHPNGDMLLVATNTDGAYMWKWDDGDQTAPVPTPPDLNQIYASHGERPRLHNIAFDPEGRFLAATSNDRSGDRVLVWTQGLSNPPKTLGWHEDHITALSFSKDRRTILTSSKDQTVRLWSVDGQKKYVGRHKGKVHNASFSPDGKRIVTAAEDGVRIWSADLAGHKRIAVEDHPVAFFDSSSRFVIGVSSKGTASVWNDGAYRLDKMEVTISGDLYLRPFQSCQSILIDNSLFNKESKLLRFDGRRFQLKPVEGSEKMEALTVAANGDLLAFGTPKKLELRSIKSKRFNRIFKGFNGISIAVAFSKDGRFLATGSEDRVRLWDLDVISHEVYTGHTNKVWTAQYSPDGKSFLTASSDGTARIWSRDGKSKVIKHTDTVLAACFAPDGRRFVTTTSAGHAIVWSRPDQKNLHELHLPGESINSARFHPDGESVVLSTRVIDAHGHGRIYVWELGTGKAELLHENPNYPIGLARYSPDGRQIVFRTDNYDIAVRGINTEVRRFREHEYTISSIELAARGNFVVSVANKEALVWRFNDLKTALRLEHPTKYIVNSATFDSPGQRVVTTAYMDDRLFIWDINSPSEPMIISTEHLFPQRPVFSPDGKYILVPAGNDVLEFPVDLSSILAALRRRTKETLPPEYSIIQGSRPPYGEKRRQAR